MAIYFLVIAFICGFIQSSVSYTGDTVSNSGVALVDKKEPLLYGLLKSALEIEQLHS